MSKKKSGFTEHDLTPRGWRVASQSSRAAVLADLFDRFPLHEIRVSPVSLLLILDDNLKLHENLYKALEALCKGNAEKATL